MAKKKNEDYPAMDVGTYTVGSETSETIFTFYCPDMGIDIRITMKPGQHATAYYGEPGGKPPDRK
jgi:hypothetical protein